MIKVNSNGKTIRILGFAGSLRKNSFNKALLRAARELLPENATLEIFDLEGIPLFNQDKENGELPERVKEFKGKVEKSDAILIATPEYAKSFPGVLKNAMDWAERPYGHNSFDGKTAALISASPSMLGGARAQYQLRQVLVDLNVYTINRPEVFVSFAHQKFDANGRLIDESARTFLKELLENLVQTTRQMQEGRVALEEGTKEESISVETS